MTNEEFATQVEAFRQKFLDSSTHVSVRTSGSTGKPKELLVEKQRMRDSATMTCAFLNLGASDTALLCMPVDYIAGKMMVVRSIVSGMKLKTIAPTGHPFRDFHEPITFCALTPPQVYNTLREPAERQRLAEIHNVIIGGGPVDKAMAHELRRFHNNVWSTYGMTETLSHIAMRRLSGPLATDFYTPLEGVQITLSKDHTLVINAPHVCSTELMTNDIAELRPDDSFRILGRLDNVINTGGIKVQIEEAEQILLPHLTVPFAVTSVPDPKFGQAIVLLIDSPGPVPQAAIDALPTYWRPKHIVVAHIPMTETNKIDRVRAQRTAQRIIEQQ